MKFRVDMTYEEDREWVKVEHSLEEILENYAYEEKRFHNLKVNYLSKNATVEIERMSGRKEVYSNVVIVELLYEDDSYAGLQIIRRINYKTGHVWFKRFTRCEVEYNEGIWTFRPYNKKNNVK